MRCMSGGASLTECNERAVFAPRAPVDCRTEGWEVRRGAPTLMKESVMRKLGSAVKRLPTLKLCKRASHVPRLEPHVLWSIGENGRVDMKCGERSRYIIDTAKNFAWPSREVVCAERRRDSEAVTREWLRRILL